MDKNYLKELNKNILLMENLEDKESVHQLESVAFNRDILGVQSKSNIDGIRHFRQ